MSIFSYRIPVEPPSQHRAIESVAVIVQPSKGVIFLGAKLIAIVERALFQQHLTEGAVSVFRQLGIIASAHLDDISVKVVVVVSRSDCLGRGQDAADTARATAYLAGEIGSMGVGLQHKPSAIGHTQDKPILIQIAIGDDQSACIIHFFAAAAESVIAVFLDQVPAPHIADSHKPVLVVPEVGETAIVGEIAVGVVSISLLGHDHGSLAIGGAPKRIGKHRVQRVCPERERNPCCGKDQIRRSLRLHRVDRNGATRVVDPAQYRQRAARYGDNILIQVVERVAIDQAVLVLF